MVFADQIGIFIKDDVCIVNKTPDLGQIHLFDNSALNLQKGTGARIWV